LAIIGYSTANSRLHNLVSFSANNIHKKNHQSSVGFPWIYRFTIPEWKALQYKILRYKNFVPKNLPIVTARADPFFKVMEAVQISEYNSPIEDH